MTPEGNIWVGIDPGGAGNYGVALVRSTGMVQTWTVDATDHAISIIKEKVSEFPSAAGIDAPLWWSSGKSGDRQADQWLRKEFGLSGGQVQTGNSLRGAALIQGAMIAYRLREQYPGIRLTEAHPKALLKALGLTGWADIVNRFTIHEASPPANEHERDAIISAIAAREGFEGRWSRDLSLHRHSSELDPHRYWLAPVHYFWPHS